MSEQKKQLAQEIKLKFSNLSQMRRPYEAAWKEITRLITPGKDFWSEIKDSKQTSDSPVYDGTAISSVRILADGLQGFMAPRGRFFKIGLESYAVAERQPTGDLRRYLQYLEKLFTLIFERSNFYDSINIMFRTGSTIGTVVTYIEELVGEDKVVFMVAHPKQVWIAENSYNVIDTVFRKVMMSHRDILSRWEDDLSEEYAREIKTDPYKEKAVIHAVFPREDRDITKLNKENKKFASVWMIEDSDTILSEGGFDALPYIVWRWNIENGGTYGWSQGNEALNDTLTANQMGKTLIEAAHEAVHPALNIPQERMGMVDLRPRGMNPFVEPNRKISPINTLGSYPIGIDREAKKQQDIKEHFFTDMFLMLNNSMESKKTATEVMELQAEKSIILQAITARIQSELFDGIFDRILAMAMDAGWVIPPSPEILQAIGADKIKIDYINLMTAMQNRYQEMQLVGYEVDQILKYVEVAPETADVIDFEALAEYRLDRSNVPQTIIRDKRKRRLIRQQRAEMQQQQMQSENMMKQAKAIKDFGDTDADNLDQVMAAAGG